VLSCTPKYEARTYAAQRHDPWRALVRAPSPLICLKAEHHSTLGPAATARLLHLRPETRMAVVEGGTHMFPMERPDRARAAIETAVMIANPNYRDLV
jgi:pimeloyl-ACP methyl ester carboxylesterase